MYASMHLCTADRLALTTSEQESYELLWGHAAKKGASVYGQTGEAFDACMHLSHSYPHSKGVPTPSKGEGGVSRLIVGS